MHRKSYIPSRRRILKVKNTNSEFLFTGTGFVCERRSYGIFFIKAG